jgi:hypothetical protein
MIRRFLTLITIALTLVSPVRAQEDHPLLGYNKDITLPFDYQQGFIIVDVVLHKLYPLKFILDLGAENTILLKKEVATVAQLPNHKKISLYGSDLSTQITAMVSNGISLQLVNCPSVRRNIIIMESDYLVLEQYLGTKVDGILGAEFFKNLIVHINYRKSELKLTNPLYLQGMNLSQHNSYDISVVDHKPYVNTITEVIPGKETNAKLLLDTGAGLTLMLHNNSDSLLQLPAQVVKGSLGKGLGGEIEGYSGRAHKLQLGELVFNNVFCNFQELPESAFLHKEIVRNGIIGNMMLERFDVVIDLSHQKLYLKPYKNYNREFEFDRSGMTIFAFGEGLNNYFIKYVIKGSPADQAGLQVGDIITKVNYFSTKWLTLKQVNRKFIKKPGTKVKVKIKRGSVYAVREVTLRDLF